MEFSSESESENSFLDAKLKDEFSSRVEHQPSKKKEEEEISKFPAIFLGLISTATTSTPPSEHDIKVYDVEI